MVDNLSYSCAWKLHSAFTSNYCPKATFLQRPTNCLDLVAQGRTVAEALEIARDVAKKLD